MCFVTFSWIEPNSLYKIKAFHETGGPVWAEIDITENCNFNCKWCYASCDYTKTGNEMSIETFKNTIGVLKTSGVTQITISGGEPLMNSHIYEMVNIASSNGFTVHMNSNGWLIDESCAKKLKSAGLSQVQINIDSIDETRHDMIRGKKRSFKKAVSALKNVIKCGMVAVSETVLTTENIGEMKSIMDFSRGIGVQRVRIWDMTPSGKATNKSSLIPPKYYSFLADIADYAILNGAKNIVSYEPTFPAKTYSVPVYHLPCPAKNGAGLVVGVNGDVRYCCTKNVVLYNIFDYKNIVGVHKKIVALVNDKMLNQRVCKGCEIYDTCRSGCPSRYHNQKDMQCIKSY